TWLHVQKAYTERGFAPARGGDVVPQRVAERDETVVADAHVGERLLDFGQHAHLSEPTADVLLERNGLVHGFDGEGDEVPRRGRDVVGRTVLLQPRLHPELVLRAVDVEDVRPGVRPQRDVVARGCHAEVAVLALPHRVLRQAVHER